MIAETRTLLGELEATAPERSVQRLEHGEGHRLPADEAWYGPVVDFVEAHSA